MPDEELDACDVSFDIFNKNTHDDDIVALQLFADVDFTNPSEVEKRKAEWEELFDASNGVG